MPVEALFPQGGGVSSWASSGWSRVLGIDAVGGPPHCDFAERGRCSGELPGGAQTGSAVTLAGVILDLVGEVGDQLGSLCQVGPPDGMGMERWWNAGEPGQRTWVGRRELWEAPVEDGGHVACGSKVASGAAVSRWGGVGAFRFRPRASRCARRVGQAGSPMHPQRTRSS